jgi:hypothetical protein
MKFDLFSKKNFTCGSCGKRFKAEIELEEHQRQHGST